MIDLDKVLSVAGSGDLFSLVGNRPNGLILENIQSKKRSFFASRTNQFTPLGTIGIYSTEDDTLALSDLFQRMLDQIEDNPPVDPKDEADKINAYFADVMPEVDDLRVKLSDKKKAIKWFVYLKENNGLVIK